MAGNSQNDFKESLERLLKKYHNLISIILFSIGFGLRLLSNYILGIRWQIIGDFGTFLAGTIAISFIYNRFIKADDRKLFISDLNTIIESKFNEFRNQSKPFHIFELGRMPIHEKVTFFQDAKSEIYEFGLSLSTFTGFFEQRPIHEYKQPVIELLQRGVNFKCLILDPENEIASLYSKDRGEADLIEKLRNSVRKLSELSDEFREMGLKGSFEVYTYSHIPYCYVLLVDPKEVDGRAYISHYMHETKRADTPILEVHKSSNPILFEKYTQMVVRILATSKKIESA